MAKKLLTYAGTAKPIVPKETTCGLCDRGMRSFKNDLGKWIASRCDCWLGKGLAEAEVNSIGEPNAWRKVVTLSPEFEPRPETITSANVKGLAFIKMHSPDLYRRIPKHIIERIDAYAQSKLTQGGKS